MNPTVWLEETSRYVKYFSSTNGVVVEPRLDNELTRSYCDTILKAFITCNPTRGEHAGH